MLSLVYTADSSNARPFFYVATGSKRDVRWAANPHGALGSGLWTDTT